MVVGGESITRNLLYGLKDCEEFGDAMMIGYLPDSFGQSAQIPQILNGFGRLNRSLYSGEVFLKEWEQIKLNFTGKVMEILRY